MRLRQLAWASVVSIWTVAGTAIAQDPVPAPAYKVGDSWTYTQNDRMDRARGAVKVTETVTFVSEKGIETSVEGDPRDPGPRRYTPERNVLRSAGFDFEPMIPNYSFPLAVGKRWEGRYSFFNQALGNRVNASQQATVEGWEEVKVPAGTFKALKISITRDLDVISLVGAGRRFTRAYQLTIWYVPEVRASVRTEFKSPAFQDELSELVEFKRAP